MVVDTTRDEISPLGINNIVCRDIGDFGATYDGCYAVAFDKYAAYILLAFVDNGGLLNQGGHGSWVEGLVLSVEN